MKYFRMIYLRTASASQKQKLMDTLLVHQIVCFGVGPHLLVIDELPEGAKRLQNPVKTLKLPAVQKVMKVSGASLVRFGRQRLASLQKYLSAGYVYRGRTRTSLTYHSKTQPASFTIYQNGQLQTSKDLLDVALMADLIRVINGQKPVDPQVQIAINENFFVIYAPDADVFGRVDYDVPNYAYSPLIGDKFD